MSGAGEDMKREVTGRARVRVTRVYETEVDVETFTSPGITQVWPDFGAALKGEQPSGSVTIEVIQ